MSTSSLDSPPAADAPCVHCATLCGNTGVTENGKAFCCRGCAMVYQILQGSGLEKFYELDDQAGVRAGEGTEQGQYEFLADPEVIRKVIDFTDGRTTRITMTLPQIHCVACVWLLERLYKLNPGIGRTEVNFTRKTITVPFEEDQITLVEVATLLAKLGYPPEFRLQQIQETAVDRTRRRELMQLGVAGFAFGNIMLLSFPGYLGLEITHHAALARVFGGVSWLLSLPVLLFSAREYFRSAWMGLQQKEISIDVPIALGILALFGQSTLDILFGWGEGYLDSLAGLVFFLLIGKFFQRRTFDALSFDRDYTHYFPLAAQRVNADGSRASVSLDRLRPGDRICVRNGELIPADAILIKGPALIDYSFVTGESVPEERITGETLYAGGRHHGPAIEVDVIKEVSQSYLTSLWNHQSFRKENERKFDQFTRSVSKVFTFAVLAIAGVTGLTWLMLDASHALRIVAAVLIVACPCALALSAPFVFGTALRVVRPFGLFLKNGFVIEGMARVRHLAFDKTGTLTRGGLGEVEWQGEEMGEDLRTAVVELASNSTHPLSRAIVGSAGCQPANSVSCQAGGAPQEHPGKGIEGWVRDRHLRMGSAAWLRECGLEVPEDGNVRVWVSEDRKVLGGYTFQDHLRDGMAESLPRLGKGYDLSLLTGDRASGVESLKQWIPDFSDTRAELSPADKLTAIDELRRDGLAVMMVGDGLNDAGALRHSDVGVAVAEDVQAFSPACDAILDADALKHMPKFLRFSRLSMNVVGVCFAISLFYNAAGIAWAASGHLSPLVAAVLMPLSSVSVLLVSVGGTHFAARLAGLSGSRRPSGHGPQSTPSGLWPEGQQLQSEAAA